MLLGSIKCNGGLLEQNKYQMWRNSVYTSFEDYYIIWSIKVKVVMAIAARPAGTRLNKEYGQVWV